MSYEISDFVLPYLTLHLPQEGKGLRLLEQDGSEYLVAYRNNEIAAVLQLTPDANLLGFVLPAYRRQGLATEVWNEAVECWGVEQPEELSADGEAFFASLDK